MDIQKRLLLIIAVALVFVSFVYFFTSISITGKAIASTTGTATLCLGRAPEIIAIGNQDVTVGEIFSLQVNATFFGSNTTIKYYDNTTLFNINQSGYISFTPVAADAGLHSIKIIVEDASDCLSINSSEIFLLNISAAAVPAAAEAAAAAAAPSAGGGGNLPIHRFTLSDNLLKVALKEYESLTKKVVINNTGVLRAEVDLNHSLPGLIELAPSSFELPAGEGKSINIIFNPYKNATPGIYYGRVGVAFSDKYSRSFKAIDLVLEIESREIIFDASIDLFKKTVKPGETLIATVTAYNLKDTLPVEVTLVHTILGPENKVIYEKEENITVGERASFTVTIPIDANLAPGSYLYSVKLIRGESFATATELFTVEELPAELPEQKLSPLAGLAAAWSKVPYAILAIPLMLLLILAIIIILFLVHRKVEIYRREALRRRRLKK